MEDFIKIDHKLTPDECEKLRKVFAYSHLVLLPFEKPDVITCEHCKYRERVEGYARFTRSQYYCGYEYERCDPYEMTRNANDPNYFCADAKRRTEE